MQRRKFARGCILLNRFSPYRVIFLSKFPKFLTFDPEKLATPSRNTFEWQQVIDILRFSFSFSLFRLQRERQIVPQLLYGSRRSTNDRRVVEQLAKIL